jgi:hypothetical protein
VFGDNVIDWGLIENHWTDLLRTAISIREGRLSSVTLLRRLGNHSRKNRLYRAFRELGRVIRTITLLRYLSEPELREQITAITNRTEAFHGFAQWLMFGGPLIGHNDPDHHEKIVKFNELLANCVIYSTALDITEAANALAAEGHPVDTDDLATITPYITHTIRRFGDWVLDLSPPKPTRARAWTWCQARYFPPLHPDRYASSGRSAVEPYSNEGRHCYSRPGFSAQNEVSVGRSPLSHAVVSAIESAILEGLSTAKRMSLNCLRACRSSSLSPRASLLPSTPVRLRDGPAARLA